MVRNITIQAGVKSDEIDIFGDIGESWFDEGHTMQSVRASIEGLKAPELIVNISSLGGDVSHALAIHDMLKMHHGKVTARVTGFTASSGTIIAMAADSVEMSDNALFLVHNAWGMTMGNQHELREMADELKKVDDRIINIYAKKTGKRKDSIHNLMKEEKWIDASEAKSWGFVDNIFEPVALAASVIKTIENEKKLPEIPKSLINNINEMDLKAEFQSFKDSVNETIEGIKAQFADKNKTVEVTIMDNAELTEKLTEFENKVSETVDALHTKETELEAVQATVVAKEAELTALNTEVERLKATATAVVPTDSTPNGDTVVNPWDVVANAVKAKI